MPALRRVEMNGRREGSNMNASVLFACSVLLSILAPLEPALAQTPPTSTPGYDVQRSQSVQTAPVGSVGRKTTDREHRIGNAPDTRGTEATYVLTFGGFARRCPTSAGRVTGDFEYSITYDGTRRGDGGEISREHYARRLVVRLEGQVGDDAKLTYVDMTGDLSIESSGTTEAPTSERRPVKTRFTPGPQGEPDVPAMRAAVEMTADIAVASAVLAAGMLYRTAELEWSKLNECVEFTFDPPTDTQQLGPNESRQVRIGLRSREDGAAVPWMSNRIQTIDGVGEVSPKVVEAAAGAPVTLTYTASAQPRRGNGLEVTTQSRAGVANAKWRIVELARYEGTFTQMGTMSLRASDMTAYDARYGVGGSQNSEITGRLIWTPDGTGRRFRTFGDVASIVYVPTDGEITVKLRGEGHSIAGACVFNGEKTFAIRDLTPADLQYLQLEVAQDGRYRLMLGMIVYSFEVQVEVTCPVPSAGLVRTTETYDATIGLRLQQGVLTNGMVAGETTEPVVAGPFRYTGRWEFRPSEPRR
jgi:hypothetical protein